MNARGPAVLLAVAVSLVGCRSTQMRGECLSGERYKLSDKDAQFGTTEPDHDIVTDVLVRSLGAGGVLIQWKGDAIVVSPYFSRYPRTSAAVEPDSKRIVAGLEKVEKSRVQALLFGSSSYDRLSDAVQVAEQLRNADIYVNKSGKFALAPYLEQLGKRAENKGVRVKAINGKDHPRMANTSVWLRGGDGNPVPIRVRALAYPNEYADGVAEDFDGPWDEFRLDAFLPGERFAFQVELYDDARTALEYKILVALEGDDFELAKSSDSALEADLDDLGGDEDQDGFDDAFDEGNLDDLDAGQPKAKKGKGKAAQEVSSGDASAALDGPAPLDPHGGQFDLVVISLRNHILGQGIPRRLLTEGKAGHVLVLDYESLEESKSKGLRLGKDIAAKPAGEFVCELDKVIQPFDRPKPKAALKGTKGFKWSMPLPGEWLVFPTRNPPPKPEPEPEPAAAEDGAGGDDGDPKPKPKPKPKKKKPKKKKKKRTDSDVDVVIVDDE